MTDLIEAAIYTDRLSKRFDRFAAWSSRYRECEVTELEAIATVASYEH